MNFDLMLPDQADPIGILPEGSSSTIETLTGEIQTLRRCVRDLVALSALPSAWPDWEPVTIAESLADLLLSALRPDFIYIGLKDLPEEAGVEVIRVRENPEVAGCWTGQIRQALTPYLKFDRPDLVPFIPNPIGKGMIRLAAAPMGYLGQGGIIVAGSQQPNFPTDIDNLLLRVSAKQVTSGLQAARLLLERKKVEKALTEGVRQQAALYQLADQLHRTRSLDDVYHAALQAIISALQCDRASILLFDQTGVMRFVGWRGLSEAYRKTTEGHSPWKPDEKNPEPIGINDIDLAEISDALKAVIKGEGIRALAFIPLVSNERLIGKFMTYFNTPHVFSANEFELSLTIAHQLAFGIDRKRAEASLRESEARFRAVANVAPSMIWTASPDGTITYANEQWFNYVGITPEENAQHWPELVLHPDDLERCLTQWTQALQSGTAYEIEVRNRHHSGEFRWFLTRAVPVRDSEGRITAWFGATTDIHHRKQMEEALRESEARFRTLADTAPVMIWMAGPDQQFTYFNKRWLAFTGRTIEEELGLGWAKGLHPDDTQPCLEIYTTAFEARRPFEMEYRLRRFDGNYYWVVNHGVPRFEADQFLGYIGSCIDIHVRKRVELEERLLAEAGKALASSLDPTVRLSNLARLIVPDLADWCTVTLFDPDWSVYHMVVAHVDQAKVDLAYDLQRRYPPRQEELANEARPWQRGQSELYPEITEAMLAADARDAEHYQILRDLNLRSAMAVPLAARGRVLGLMLFVWAESGHRYDEQDLALAEDLARRAAIALDNARLYEAEQLARQVAEKTTQRIAALQTITAALSIALTPAEVSDVILQKSVSVLQAGGGAVMLLSEDGESLEIFRATGYSEAGLKPFQRFPLAASIPASEAVRSGKAVWITSHHDFEARYPHLAFARPAESRTEGVAVVPMLLEGRALGALAVSFEKVRAFSADDKDFLETLASLCTQALDRAHLYEAERKARTEAEAAQHSLALLAEVRERNRLAQELHDNVAQTVAYLNLKIASLPQLFASNQPEKIRAELSELKQVVGAAYTDIRGEIFNLRAGPADEINFLETLDRYLAKYKRFYQLDIQLIFETAKTQFELPAQISIPLIRTIQEALMNVRKHARVDKAYLRLSRAGDQIRISIEDQGQGFDPTQEKASSFGLKIMRERIESIGGRLEIESRPGQGTQVTLLYSPESGK